MTAVRRSKEPASEDKLARLAQLVLYANHRPTFTLAELGRDVPAYGVWHLYDEDGNGPLLESHDDETDWGSFRRKFIRDHQALAAECGIELRTELYGRDHVYRLAAPFLSAAEHQALDAARAAVALGGGDDGPAREVSVWLDRLVGELFRAISRRQVVRFAYSGKARTVEPHALGWFRGRWYLGGREVESDIVKNFALDRIEGPGELQVDAGEKAFERPPTASASSVVALDPNDWGTDPELDARLEVDPDVVPLVLADLSGARWVGSTAAGELIGLTVRHRRSFIARLLGFGDRVRLVGPPELVEELQSWLRPMAGA